MEHKEIVACPTAAAWVPLRIVLAWRVTAGDHKFMELVRGNPWFDRPCVMAAELAEEMAKAGCIFMSPHRRSERLAVLAKPPGRRFQHLAADFEVGPLRRLQEVPGSERQQDWLRSHDMCRAKVFKFTDLKEYLEGRIDNAMSDMCVRISNGELRARGVAVDQGVERPAGDLPPSAVTETMELGRSTGLLHQSPHSTRAWMSVTVCWQDFVKCYIVSGTPTETIVASAPTSGQCISRIEAVRRALPVVFKDGVPPGMTVKERNLRIGDHMVKVGGRRPSARTFQRAFAPKRRARTKRG
jgi:hypothetical protein